MKDIHGLALGTSVPAAGEAFNRALHSYLGQRADLTQHVKATLEADPEFAMGHCLMGTLMMLAYNRNHAALAVNVHRDAAALGRGATAREQAHIRALGRWVAGDMEGALGEWEATLASWPADVLAMRLAHFNYFWLGRARDMRASLERIAPHWSHAMAAYPTLLSCQAFALEECGDYGRAEETARHALALEPYDGWAQHAVAHVMEMQGRAEDGIGWMVAREPYWSGDTNFFKVHNFWHRALCHLDLGQMDPVWGLYDGPIRGSKSAVALDLVDASALLWRVWMAGHDAGDRWHELAQAWDAHADGVLYPFNDVHAVMAYLGAERHDAIERVRAAQASAASRSRGPVSVASL